MNRFGSVFLDSSHNVLIDLLRHEGDHRSRALAEVLQRFIKGHVGVDLVLLHAACPETVPAAADIPVGHVVHKAFQRSCRFGNPVGVKVTVHVADHGIHTADQPFVHDRELIVIERVV